MKPMLPFSPQTATEAKSRWHRALAKVWEWEDFDPQNDMQALLTGEIDRPGLYRTNVFDFHDGLRLIVSEDSYKFGKYLHVSGAAREKVGKKFGPPRKPFDYEGLAVLVHDRVLFMSGRHVTLGFYHGPPTHLFNVVHCFDPPLPPDAKPSDGSIVPRKEGSSHG